MWTAEGGRAGPGLHTPGSRCETQQRQITMGTTGWPGWMDVNFDNLLKYLIGKLGVKRLKNNKVTSLFLRSPKFIG